MKVIEGLDAPDVTLEAAAKAADVGVQSLVRRFRTKDGLYAAAFARARSQYRPSREQQPKGSDTFDFIVKSQLDIYERWGKALLYLRTQENDRPVLHRELENRSPGAPRVAREVARRAAA
ncbi:MAG: TetR/AcrR family transcriptional regulator [Myxococcales bacterium]